MTMIKHIDLDSANIGQQIDTIREVAKTTGCLIVRGSQFESNWQNTERVNEELDEMYKSEWKHEIGNVAGLGATRGFFPMGAETGDKKNIEYKESFSFGDDQIPASFKSTLVADNIWPEKLSKPLFNSLSHHMNTTALDIVKLLQLSFPHLKIIDTVDETSQYQSFTRSFKYYPKHEIGNSLHTDWNLLTLVWTDKPGLQVYHEGEYIDYADSDREYSLICNFGDFLSSMSNGEIKSPWHRVVMNEEERNSLVFFYYPKHSQPVAKKKIYNEKKLLGVFVD